MDDQNYHQLLYYLERLEYPPNITDDARNYIRQNWSNYFSDQGRLYKKGVPTRQVLNRRDAVQAFVMFHSSPLGGHFAFKNTYLKISARYYWPSMKYDVEQWVITCPRCQLKGKEMLKEPLHPIPIPIVPFHQVAMDILHLPQSRGTHRYIIVAIDYFSKWVEARPLIMANTIEVCNFFIEDVITRHATPKVLITDNGSPFSSAVMSQLCMDFNIKQRFISAYHAASNGLVERFNRTLGMAMRMLPEELKPDWHLYLPMLLFAYPTMPQASTKRTPFMLLYGREPRTLLDNIVSQQEECSSPDYSDDMVVQAFLKGLQDTEAQRSAANANIIKAQRSQAQFVERRIANDKFSYQLPFKIGETVLLYNEIQSRRASEKLHDRYTEPYYIYQVFPNSTYIIKSQAGELVPRHVHGNKLKIYKAPSLPLPLTEKTQLNVLPPSNGTVASRASQQRIVPNRPVPTGLSPQLPPRQPRGEPSPQLRWKYYRPSDKPSHLGP